MRGPFASLVKASTGILQDFHTSDGGSTPAADMREDEFTPRTVSSHSGVQRGDAAGGRTNWNSRSMKADDTSRRDVALAMAMCRWERHQAAACPLVVSSLMHSVNANGPEDVGECEAFE